MQSLSNWAVVGLAGVGGMALSGDADDDCVPFILASSASSSKTRCWLEGLGVW